MNIHYRNIFIKLLVFFAVILVIGLPIIEPNHYYFLLFCLTIIIFSKISFNKKSIFFLLSLIFLYSIYKLVFPSFYIQEGHNVLLLNKNSYNFYKNNLPENIFKFLDSEFKIYFNESKCDENLERCWKNFNPEKQNLKSSPTDQIYAKSSDWYYKKISYSRVVNNINFFNLKSAKIGAVNNLDFNFFWNDETDISRENIPFFVMYEFPKKIIGSSLCWKGNLFWQKNNSSFENISNKNFKCKIISKSDIGKKVYGLSFGKKNQLILKLQKNLKITLEQIINNILKIILVILIILLFSKFDYKLFLYSFLFVLGFLLLLYYVNKDLIYGFDIFSGGNDGLIYMSYSNVIFNNLTNLNIYEALKGVESVFYFPSSLRYFWSLNKLFFGETFYGYLTVGFFFPIIFFYIFYYILDLKWSIILTLLVSLTRLFEGYALSLVVMVQHINAGDAEPLAIFFMLSSILIFLNFTKLKTTNNSNFYNFLFGFLLSLSVSLRPNFLPSALILLLSFIFHKYFYNKNYKSSFWILLGFSFLLVIPFHNYYYGDAILLFSSGSSHNTNAPLSLYYEVFIDFFKLNLNSNISVLINQFNEWIKPSEIHYIITFLILLSLLKFNNFYIRSLCLLALSQHAVLLIYEATNRYAYLAWMITLILNFYFIKNYFFALAKKIRIKK